VNTTNEQKKSKKELLEKGWTYLNDNFHKFTEENRIKIALALCTKDMPTQLSGSMQVNQMPTVTLGEKPLELNIGNDPNPPQNS